MAARLVLKVCHCGAFGAPPRRTAGQTGCFCRSGVVVCQFGCPGPVSGIIFSNELLDAMPVYVLQWQRGRWVELRVTVKSDSFVWQPVELNTHIGQPTI